MRYLLVKEKGKRKYNLYSNETFGMNTWGSSSQDSLVKKKKYWYVQHWSAGNEWIEDEEYEYKLNVVKETADLDEIISYLVAHNVKEIEPIIQSAKEIYNDYLNLMMWMTQRY